MARPRRGVRVPLLCRPPGIGGRSKGAGDDILGGEGFNEGRLVLEDESVELCPPAVLLSVLDPDS